MKVFRAFLFPFILLLLFQSVKANYTENAMCSMLITCEDCLSTSGCGWCYNERQCQNDKGNSCPSKLIFDKCRKFRRSILSDH